MSQSRDDTKVTANEFDQTVRSLIDQFLASGGEVEKVEEILDYHREGAKYYADDLNRRLAQQQQQAEIDPEEIEEDSVEAVE